MAKQETAITPVEYKAFQDAYDFFNRELFGDAPLPHVLVTLQRKANTKGYFSPNRFSNRTMDSVAHEVAMNPDTFVDRSDEEILSTLVHEMVHVWEHVSGKSSRSGYHNKHWAGKMKEVGLQPTSTGQPGGKETGQKMTHYIIPDGRYQTAFRKLAATGFKLNWQSGECGPAAAKKSGSKTKFSCPECELNAWAKPDAILICGSCYEDGEDIQLMVEAA